MVEQSIENFVRDGLITRGYNTTQVKLRDAFPTPAERSSPLTVTQVAVGYNFDDGGVPIELGSDMTRRQYTIEFWVFGVTPQFGRNIAHVVKSIFETAANRSVPLQDIREKDLTVIGELQLADQRATSVMRQLANDPRPWDINVWSTLVRILDEYNPYADGY